DTDYNGTPDQWHDYKPDGTRPLIRLDTSGNGRADEWRHFQDDRLSMVKRDQNADGTVDEIVHYDPKGNMTQVLRDFDAPDQPRTRLLYEAGQLVRGEFDTNRDAKTDQWHIYDAKGNLLRAMYDQNRDGRQDQWEYFKPGQAKPYRVERDTSGNGKADAIWEQPGPKR
ncbi:MAG: hypothetical protein ETSY2_35725, partial [Candidatus Entotheonella gemina]